MHPIMKTRSKKLAVLTLPYALLLIFMLTTNPARLPVVFLLLPFVLLFGCLATTFYVCMAPYADSSEPRLSRITVSVCSGLLPTLLLLLKSINQLGFLDVLLMTVIIASSAFYIRRINFIG